MCAVAMWMRMVPNRTTTEIKCETGACYGVPNPYDRTALRQSMSKLQMNR
jgi:hypothetical protein